MADAGIERAGQRAGRDWKDVLIRTFKEIMKDRVTFVAAGVTYFLLLAIFPSLTALVSIYGLVSDPATVQQQIAGLAGVLPEGGMVLLEEHLARLASQGTPTLGFALLVSLVIALWSSSVGVKALFEAMNIAYGEEEKRGFIAVTLTALLFTIVGVVGAVMMLLVVVAMPLVLSFIGLGTGTEWLVRIGSYALLVLMLLVGLAALYRFGPSRKGAKWRLFTPGALLAVTAIIVMSLLFSWYAANFANYEGTYGSLGALIGFLTWVWLSVTLVLVGAELNSEVERDVVTHAEHETTAAGADDVPDGEDHSPEWRAGYLAGLKRRGGPRSSLPLAAALPAALALDAVRKRSERHKH